VIRKFNGKRPASTSPEAGRKPISPVVPVSDVTQRMEKTRSQRRGSIPHGRTIRKVMIEKAYSRYLSLTCGHFCPIEVAVIYSVFGDGTQVFCEHKKCGDFRNVLPSGNEILYAVPDEPMF